MPVWNIAHRGGAGLWPENTMAAFAGAIARGFDGAELDVQLSADGVVVVHHDYRLNPALARKDGVRLTGETPRIKDLSFAELQAFDIGCPDDAYLETHPRLKPVEGQFIPALTDIVAAARPSGFHLFVELKSGASADSADPQALADAALTVILDAGYLARTVFVGFDWRGLLRIKKIVPDAACWFTTDRLDGDVRPVLDAIRAHGGDGWFPHYANATAEAIGEARRRGLKIGAWTVNDAADLRRLSSLDALCTDRPDRLQALE